MRLVFCGFIAVAIIGTIGTRIVGLAEAHTNLRLAVHGQAAAAMRGRILDREGRLLASNLPITVLHANPSEIMNGMMPRPALPRYCRIAPAPIYVPCSASKQK